MKDLICAAFIKDNKLFCCKSKENADCWSLPFGIYGADFTAETHIAALKKEILSNFEMPFYVCIGEDGGPDVKITTAYCVSKDKDIVLSVPRDVKWLAADKLDNLAWDPSLETIIPKIKEQLQPNRYTLAIAKSSVSFDGWNTSLEDAQDLVDIVWTGSCSAIEVENKFLNLIHERAAYCNSTGEGWRGIKLYDASGKQIKQEG